MNKTQVGIILAIIGSLMFSSKAVFVKLAYQYPVDSISLLTIRMLSALLFYIAVLYSARRLLGNISKRHFAWAALAGILGYYIASFLDFWGLQFIDASVERMILFTYPTFIVLISWLALKEKITWQIGVSLIVSYIGLLFVFSPNLSNLALDAGFWKGAFAILTCSFAFATYMVMSQQLIPKFGPTIYTSFCMIVACSAIIVHYLFSYPVAHLLSFETPVYLYGFAMGILATLVPSYLMNFAIVRIGASRTAIIASVGPISTLTLAYLFLGERFISIQWLGAACIIGSVTIISLKRKKKKLIKQI